VSDDKKEVGVERRGCVNGAQPTRKAANDRAGWLNGCSNEPLTQAAAAAAAAASLVDTQ